MVEILLRRIRSCGSGYKERKVECKQLMAQERKVERNEELCPGRRPESQKACNTKPCPPEDQHPAIAYSNTTYIQHDPKKTKVTLKIGGAATVFLGTQIKIKCPVKRFVWIFFCARKGKFIIFYVISKCIRKANLSIFLYLYGKNQNACKNQKLK